MIRAMSPEDAYWAALASYSESIKCGVTAVNDMYRRLEALADAAEKIGIRAVLSNDVACDEHDLDTLADNEQAFREKNGAANGRVKILIGIEWLPLASEELLSDARTLANELGTGIHIHLNESLSEVEISKEMFGRRPTEVAYDNGILGPDCIAAHCVWLSDSGARAHARDAHADLPQPELERKARKRSRPPARDARRRAERRARPRRRRVQQQPRHVRGDEVRVADAPGRRGSTPASGRRRTSCAWRARTATAGLGIDAGELSPGKKADLILVDTQNQMFTPLMPGSKEHVFSHLVFAANGSCVETVIIDGQIVYEDAGVHDHRRGRGASPGEPRLPEVVERMDVPDLESVRRS